MGIKNTEIVEELALPPVKVHCSVLAEDAIKAAIKNYQEKQDTVEENSTETAAAAVG
jgi:nitrogen fixation NifU-like protein